MAETALGRFEHPVSAVARAVWRDHREIPIATLAREPLVLTFAGRHSWPMPDPAFYAIDGRPAFIDNWESNLSWRDVGGAEQVPGHVD
jgi:hypothetical protein